MLKGDGMKYKFDKCGEKLKPGDFEKVEKIVGAALPDSIKNLYKKYNGGQVEGGRCVFVNSSNGMEYEVRNFLPMIYPRYKEDSLVEDSYVFFVKEKKLIPKKYIPIAMDSGGFRYCVSIVDEKVYFFNFDNEDVKNGKELVADSIEDFVNSLLTEDEAYK